MEQVINNNCLPLLTHDNCLDFHSLRQDCSTPGQLHTTQTTDLQVAQPEGAPWSLPTSHTGKSVPPSCVGSTRSLSPLHCTGNSASLLTTHIVGSDSGLSAVTLQEMPCVTVISPDPIDICCWIWGVGGSASSLEWLHVCSPLL